LLSSNTSVGYSQEGTSSDWADKEGAIGLGNAEKKFLEKKESLEKERIQLEKEQVKLDQDLETLKQQIFGLSLTIEQMKNNKISQDTIEELEEQLTELQFDKNDLEDSQVYLQARQDTYEKNWKIIQESPYFETLINTNTLSEPESIPSWFKSNAKWWKEGLISDADMINTLESLIIQDVIPLDNFVKTSSGLEHATGVSSGGTFVTVNDKPKIPTYQKDVFGFWSDGLVSDSEIVNSIGHLMSEGIINSEKIQTEISERRQQKMIEEYDPDSDKDPDGIHDYDDPATTIITPKGSIGVNIDVGINLSKDVVSKPFAIPDEIWYEVSPKLKAILDSELNPKLNLKSFADFEEYEEYYDNKVNSMGYQMPPISAGGMQQLTQVSAFTIDGIQFPVSQFTLWKWIGECDDTWHYHTNTGHAVSLDSLTGIPDPDQENCGFGKVGEVFVGTSFMSQAEIDKFRKLTGYDPLTNEVMMGGSDTGSNTSENGPKTGNDSVEEGPDRTSLEEADGGSSGTSDKLHESLPGDSDGDGIADAIDAKPDEYSDELSIDNEGLPAKIISRGGHSIKITSGGEGALVIEVGANGGSDPVIIEIMGVEFEVAPGTIFEAEFR